MDQAAAFDLVSGYLVKHFDVPPERVSLEANLFTDLKLDSIDALDMVGLLEADVNVEIREAELRKIRTVRDVVDYIVAHLPAET